MAACPLLGQARYLAFTRYSDICSQIISMKSILEGIVETVFLSNA